MTASVFAHGNEFSSQQVFVDNFKHALWVAITLSAVGVIVALMSPGRAAPRATVVPAADTVADSAEPTGKI